MNEPLTTERLAENTEGDAEAAKIALGQERERADHWYREAANATGQRDRLRSALRICAQALCEGCSPTLREQEDPDGWREWRTFTARPAILEAKTALGLFEEEG